MNAQNTLSINDENAQLQATVSLSSILSSYLGSSELNAHPLHISRSGEFTITVEGLDEIDPYIRLFSKNSQEIIATDDDGWYDLNSGFKNILLKKGDYLLLVEDYNEESGSYLASVSSKQFNILPSESISAVLNDEAGKIYTYQGKQGDVLQITMESNDLDTWYWISDENNYFSVFDSGAQDSDTLATQVILPENGTYYISAVGLPMSNQNGSFTLSIEKTEGEIVNQQLGAGKQSNYLNSNTIDSWSLYGVANVSIDLETSNAAFDTVMKLFDSDGKELISNDDIGSYNINSRISYTLPYTGKYRVSISNTDGESGDYDLAYSLSSSSTEVAVQSLSLGSQTSFVNTNSYNIWSFDGNTNEVIILETSNALFDTIIVLFDEDGNELEFNDDIDDGESTDSRISYVLPYSGEYRVNVSGYNGESGNYDFSYALLEVKPLVNGNQSSYLDSGSFDFWSFYGDRGKVVNLETNNTTFDTVITLLDSSGNELDYNDDINANNFDSRLSYVLPYTGEYRVTVSGYDEGGNYDLYYILGNSKLNSQLKIAFLRYFRDMLEK